MLISTDEAIARLNNPENLARRKETKESARPNRVNDLAERKDARSILPEHPDDHSIIRPLHNGGRRKGDTNLDDETRALIGAEGQLVTLDELSDKFNISHHHAHELSNGKVYTEAGVDKKLVKNINNKLAEPHQLAVDKLTETLLALDTPKIQVMNKAKDLVYVASTLARIAESTSPLKHKEEDPEDKGSARIIIYSPTIKQENHYASIETTLVRTDSNNNV